MIALDHQSLASGFISGPYFIIYETFPYYMHQLAFYFLLFVSTFFANLPFIN
jgi:hypothetical protein